MLRTLAFALVVAAAFPAMASTDLTVKSPGGTNPEISVEADAVLRSHLEDATKCIAEVVRSETRNTNIGSALNDRITEAMVPCVEAMRAMIDAIDRIAGLGFGELFFMGPYLENLPAAVEKRITSAP